MLHRGRCGYHLETTEKAKTYPHRLPNLADSSHRGQLTKHINQLKQHQSPCCQLTLVSYRTFSWLYAFLHALTWKCNRLATVIRHSATVGLLINLPPALWQLVSLLRLHRGEFLWGRYLLAHREGRGCIPVTGLRSSKMTQFPLSTSCKQAYCLAS